MQQQSGGSSVAQAKEIHNSVKRGMLSSWKRRVLAVVIIVVIVVFLEVLFNYRALTEGYQEVDLTDAIELVDESSYRGYEIHGRIIGENPDDSSSGDRRQVYSVLYIPDVPLFIEDIRVSGRFPSTEYYKVLYNGVTDFGTPETQKELEDSVNSWYEDSYTHIGKRVSAIRLILPKAEGVELVKVSLSNRFIWNPFRMAALLSFFLLGWLILREKIFSRRPVMGFAVSAILFGIFFSIGSSYYHYGWDERNHFYSVYCIVKGRTVEQTKAVSAYISKEGLPETDTLEEFLSLQKSLNKNGNEVTKTYGRRYRFLATYKEIIYLPEIVGLWIGMVLGAGFPLLFQLGRLGNLLSYVLLMGFAIHLTESKKLFLLFAALMPTPIFLASTYSYDAQIFACLTLAEVLWYRVQTESAHTSIWQKQPSGKRRWMVFASGILFILGSLMKPVYIPLILLLLLLPGVKRQSSWRKKILILCVASACVVLVATFALPMIRSLLSGNAYVTADSRGGDTDVLQQAYLMLQHPLSSVKLILGSIFQLDNFRNVGNAAGDTHFFLSLKYLNLGLLGVLNDRWIALMLPVMTLALLYDETQETSDQKSNVSSAAGTGRQYDPMTGPLEREDEDKVIGLGIVGKSCVALLLFIVVLLIWLSMYLAFSAVGSQFVDGVQMRYYLPLTYLLAVVVQNRAIQIRVKRSVMVNCLFMTCLVLDGAAVLELILHGRFL